jgi:hypothetical protein
MILCSEVIQFLDMLFPDVGMVEIALDGDIQCIIFGVIKKRGIPKSFPCDVMTVSEVRR